MRAIIILVSIVLSIAAIGLVLIAVYFGKIKKRNRNFRAALKQKLEGGGGLHLTKSDEDNKILLKVDEISKGFSKSTFKAESEKENSIAIIENLTTAIFALDSQLLIKRTNNAARKLFGFSEFNKDIKSIVRNVFFLSKLHEVLKTNSASCFDFDFDTAKLFSVNIFPVQNEKISLIIAIEEVTNLRKLQAEKLEFFANASHELNTPLSVIMGYSEILEREEKYNPEFITSIKENAIRMDNLIKDMLYLSRIGEEKELSDERVSVLEVASRVIESHKIKAKEKSISIKASLKEGFVYAQSEKVAIVISNLLDNAIKYSKANSEVLLKVYTNQERVKIRVSDSGEGIEKVHHSRIFERFFRADKSRNSGGTGLGLAIVKNICNLYKATITLDSIKSVGTTITVSWPSFINEEKG